MGMERTAFILVGFQNDYFASDGILRAVIDEADRTRNVLENTLHLVNHLVESKAILIQTPIYFTKDYSELVQPVGILKAIKGAKAFCSGTPGADILPSLQAFGERIVTVEGKRGLNAFSNTRLDTVLEENNIAHVVLAGAVTSICIDSTGRAAHERGYRVTILGDCTASRTRMEQDFYCENIFPLYADVKSSQDFLGESAAIDG
jgi:nicotinamidase-related amidase